MTRSARGVLFAVVVASLVMTSSVNAAEPSASPPPQTVILDTPTDVPALLLSIAAVLASIGTIVAVMWSASTTRGAIVADSEKTQKAIEEEGKTTRESVKRENETTRRATEQAVLRMLQERAADDRRKHAQAIKDVGAELVRLASDLCGAKEAWTNELQAVKQAKERFGEKTAAEAAGLALDQVRLLRLRCLDDGAGVMRCGAELQMLLGSDASPQAVTLRDALVPLGNQVLRGDPSSEQVGAALGAVVSAVTQYLSQLTAHSVGSPTMDGSLDSTSGGAAPRVPPGAP